MWDTVMNSKEHLSHDMPCFKCGHAWHTYLPCSDECDCRPDIDPPPLRCQLIA